jgi:hypothetical protein
LHIIQSYFKVIQFLSVQLSISAIIARFTATLATRGDRNEFNAGRMHK